MAITIKECVSCTRQQWQNKKRYSNDYNDDDGTLHPPVEIMTTMMTFYEKKQQLLDVSFFF
jgi:hypothetical protein